MARQEAMLLTSVLLLLLLTLGADASNILEKLDFVASNNNKSNNNNTEIIYATSADDSHKNTSDAAVGTAPSGVESNARLAKTFSVKTVKNNFDTVHKSESYPSWTITTNNGTYKSSLARRDDKKNQSSSLTDAIREMNNRRVSAHKKHNPSRYSTTSGTKQELIDQQTTDRSLYYGVHPDDFESQAQNYDAEYFPAANHEYEENYNSLGDDQTSGYDDALKDPYRLTYMNQHEPGYFGPPITTNPYYQDPPVGGGPHYYQESPGGGGSPSYYQEPTGVVSLSSSSGACHCPTNNRANRQSCGSPFYDFLGLAGALGGNLWALGQLIGTTAAPFVIPLLALKMILVPLKILKFLNLVKIFLKLFIILPFFVRYVFPTLSSWTASLPGLFMQQMQNIFPMQQQQAQHPLLNKPHKPRPYEEIVEDEDEEVVQLEEDLESRGGANSTSYNKDQFYQMDESSMWDLRACPSRVACELGAFLGGATNSRSFPKNLASYLARKADRVEGRRMKDDKVKGDRSKNDTKVEGKSKKKKKANDDNHDYEAEDDDDENDDEDDEDEDDDEEEDEMQRNAVYKAFILALVRKWTIDKCQIYSCPVLF